jgi:hypothetical protein
MRRRSLRLLGIDLTAKGFGFALLDVNLGLLDWGFCTVRATDAGGFGSRLLSKIERGGPTVLVVENFDPTKARENAVRRLEAIIDLALARNIGMCQVSRKIVRRTLGVANKTEAAKAIAMRFPELQSRMPEHRDKRTSEDERMHIFDALSFALAVVG